MISLQKTRLYPTLTPQTTISTGHCLCAYRWMVVIKGGKCFRSTSCRTKTTSRIREHDRLAECGRDDFTRSSCTSATFLSLHPLFAITFSDNSSKQDERPDRPPSSPSMSLFFSPNCTGRPGRPSIPTSARTHPQAPVATAAVANQSRSYAKATLVGRLGAAPVQRESSNGRVYFT